MWSGLFPVRRGATGSVYQLRLPHPAERLLQTVHNLGIEASGGARQGQ